MDALDRLYPAHDVWEGSSSQGFCSRTLLLPFKSPDTNSGGLVPKSSISAAKEHYYGEDTEILAKRREKK
jgi:hypothetical protein